MYCEFVKEEWDCRSHVRTDEAGLVTLKMNSYPGYVQVFVSAPVPPCQDKFGMYTTFHDRIRLRCQVMELERVNGTNRKPNIRYIRGDTGHNYYQCSDGKTFNLLEWEIVKKTPMCPNYDLTSYYCTVDLDHIYSAFYDTKYKHMNGVKPATLFKTTVETISKLLNDGCSIDETILLCNMCYRVYDNNGHNYYFLKNFENDDKCLAEVDVLFIRSFGQYLNANGKLLSYFECVAHLELDYDSFVWKQCREIIADCYAQYDRECVIPNDILYTPLQLFKFRIPELTPQETK